MSNINKIIGDSFRIAFLVFVGVNIISTLAGDTSGWLTTIGFDQRLLEVGNWIFKMCLNFKTI